MKVLFWLVVRSRSILSDVRRYYRRFFRPVSQFVFKVGSYNRGATEARLQFLSCFIVRYFRASADRVLQLLNDFLRVSVQVLIEKIQFLLSANQCGVDRSVESCFPCEEFSVWLVTSENVRLGLWESLQLSYPSQSLGNLDDTFWTWRSVIFTLNVRTWFYLLVRSSRRTLRGEGIGVWT